MAANGDHSVPFGASQSFLALRAPGRATLPPFLLNAAPRLPLVSSHLSFKSAQHRMMTFLLPRGDIDVRVRIGFIVGTRVFTAKEYVSFALRLLISRISFHQDVPTSWMSLVLVSLSFFAARMISSSNSKPNITLLGIYRTRMRLQQSYLSHREWDSLFHPFFKGFWLKKWNSATNSVGRLKDGQIGEKLARVCQNVRQSDGERFSTEGIKSSARYAPAPAGKTANSWSQCACGGVLAKPSLASGHWRLDEHPRGSGASYGGDPSVVVNEYNAYRNGALQVGEKPGDETVFATACGTLWHAFGDGQDFDVPPIVAQQIVFLAPEFFGACFIAPSHRLPYYLPARL
ncbi:hypothetical protein B0H13DRAFT_1929575 [Mycena leptocephala]|nr:hypothetical protein B0H13DRAFT_1929575 [Mycena leptocephala]